MNLGDIGWIKGFVLICEEDVFIGKVDLYF